MKRTAIRRCAFRSVCVLPTHYATGNGDQTWIFLTVGVNCLHRAVPVRRVHDKPEPVGSASQPGVSGHQQPVAQPAQCEELSVVGFGESSSSAMRQASSRSRAESSNCRGSAAKAERAVEASSRMSSPRQTASCSAQISLVDQVLGAHLRAAQPTLPDPSSDRIRLSSIDHRFHNRFRSACPGWTPTRVSNRSFSIMPTLNRDVPNKCCVRVHQGSAARAKRRQVASAERGGRCAIVEFLTAAAASDAYYSDSDSRGLTASDGSTPEHLDWGSLSRPFKIAYRASLVASDPLDHHLFLSSRAQQEDGPGVGLSLSSSG